MKIKTLLFISVIFISVFVIYLTTLDREVYYLDISIDSSDYSYSNHVQKYLEQEEKLEKYIYEFASQDDRVTDIIYKIKENQYITINDKKQTIKNALIKADLVTLFVGLNDINYKVGYSSINELYEYADSFLEDLDEMLELIREYCKEDIIFIGYYNIYGSYYEEYFNYVNREVELICDNYDIEFIDTIDIYSSNDHTDDIALNEDESKNLSFKIIEIIKNKTLK